MRDHLTAVKPDDRSATPDGCGCTRANCEDRIRAGKQTGLANVPFRGFAHNEVWLEPR